jgi:hypothetical protein
VYKVLTKCTVYTLLFCTKCKVACTTDVVDVLYILVMLCTLTIANTALLYQTLYLEFYSILTLTYPSSPKKRFSLIIKQNLNYSIPLHREFHGLQNMIYNSKKKLMIDSSKEPQMVILNIFDRNEIWKKWVYIFIWLAINILYELLGRTS